MQKLVLLNVDEQKLNDLESDFDSEMGWVSASGITIENEIEATQDVLDCVAKLWYQKGESKMDYQKVIAEKTWTVADIVDRLIHEFEISPVNISDEMIQKVLDTGILKGLEDCTDQDWDIIYYAILQSGVTKEV